MSFTSYSFILFLAILFILYYSLPKKAQWVILLIASFTFYTIAGWKYLFYMVASIVSVYAASMLLEKSLRIQKDYLKENKETLDRAARKKYSEEKKRQRNIILGIFITFNVALLVVSKYTNFFLENINAMTGTRLPLVDFIIPLGISYYTLQSIGYLIDINRQTVTPEKNPLKLALFISFFPSLVQGPISRFADISEGLFGEHDFDKKRISFGLERILWGYFKKLVIADRLAIPVKELIGMFPEGGGAYALCLILFYTIQLYADFTGGIDITMGIAQCFGVDLKENFIRPYFSKSLKEYWRRWHISMGTWFRDYMFYPISTCRAMQSVTKKLKKSCGAGVSKRVAVYVSSLIVWLTTGIWHGASWNFIFWGFINFVILTISEEFEPLYGRFGKKFAFSHSRFYDGFKVLRTFAMLCVLKLFDCFERVGDTFSVLGSTVKVSGYSDFFAGGWEKMGLGIADYVVVLLGIILMISLSLIQRSGSVREKIHLLPFPIRSCIFIALFVAVIMLGIYGIGYDSESFIYNRF